MATATGELSGCVSISGAMDFHHFWTIGDCGSLSAVFG